MLYRIKSRCYDCGKKLKDIVIAMREKYSIDVSPPELSNAMNGTDVGPKAQQILSYANEIVSEWEKKKKDTQRTTPMRHTN